MLKRSAAHHLVAAVAGANLCAVKSGAHAGNAKGSSRFLDGGHQRQAGLDSDAVQKALNLLKLALATRGDSHEATAPLFVGHQQKAALLTSDAPRKASCDADLVAARSHNGRLHSQTHWRALWLVTAEAAAAAAAVASVTVVVAALAAAVVAAAAAAAVTMVAAVAAL